MKNISFDRLLQEQNPQHITTDVMLKTTFKCGCKTGIIFKGLPIPIEFKHLPKLSQSQGTLWHNNNDCTNTNKHSVNFEEISRISYYVDPIHIVTEIKRTNCFEVAKQRACWNNLGGVHQWVS